MKLLPPEMVDCILENFDPTNSPSDKTALFNCAQVGKAWVRPAQRRIFSEISLCVPMSWTWKNSEKKTHFLDRNSRLVRMIDMNPSLAQFATSMKLDYGDVEASVQQDSSIAAVISRLTNVKRLSLDHLHWDTCSHRLREALTNMVRSPSVACLSLSLVGATNFSDIVSLLEQMVCLKTLRINSFQCSDWTLPNHTAPSNISLEELVLRGPLEILVAWFQHKSCPFDFQSLRWLDLQIGCREEPTKEHAIGMLKCIGTSVQHLTLDADANFLPGYFKYTPNVKTVTFWFQSTSSPQWVVSSLESLLDLSSCCPLRRVTIMMSIARIDEWNKWTPLDTLLSRPLFGSLEQVEFQTSGESWQQGSTPSKPQERLPGPLLHKSGKLVYVLR